MAPHRDYFWAKTKPDGQPGISVRDHCLNVGCVAEAIIAGLPPRVRALLPGDDGQAAALLAALHDVGKITVGFQAKCPAWLASVELPPYSVGEFVLSVTDHAFVSQAFLQKLPSATAWGRWAVAVGSHHGRIKGRAVRLNNGNHLPSGRGPSPPCLGALTTRGTGSAVTHSAGGCFRPAPPSRWAAGRRSHFHPWSTGVPPWPSARPPNAGNHGLGRRALPGFERLQGLPTPHRRSGR